jgi:heme/copper-type cytochrome/quinol oxidase subunit 3
MDHAATAALHPAAAPAHAHPHAIEPETATGIHSDKMGMWVFLCSEVMFFTGLIGSYIVLRFGSASWPHPGDTLNIWLTAFNTFVLICSSVTMVKALEAIRNGNARKMKLFLSLTLLFGAFFLSVQIYEYRALLHHGFTPSVSLFGSVFYTCTGFHGFHVFCGVVCMAFVTGKAFLGKYTQASHQGIETIGLYWHFVDLVWIILFTIVYLI